MSWNTYCATPKQPKANVVRPNQHPTPDLPPPPSHKWTDPFRWGKSLIADCNAATSVSAMTPRHTTEIFAICSNPRNMLKKLKQQPHPDQHAATVTKSKQSYSSVSHDAYARCSTHKLATEDTGTAHYAHGRAKQV
eukprot:CAMPEP_0172838372 /NCGR_PEP_ID=MMETSP1075-20121228/27834_1 /TAXON_ID=2916 /ORGANISM="Ceratium fusus, Strain PA161109" /LENGTH=135 /DNA_ID=CAMNT_0013681881 /DNA_START=286 /DNA_END=689 /DNA_ORIENTATION=-